MILARVFTVLLGSVAILWGVLVFPSFWRHSPIERTAIKIVAGHPFKSELLRGQIPNVLAAEHEALCRPAALRSNAIVRLSIAEDAIAAGQRDTIDGDMQSLRHAIRLSLACSPADPYLWLVLLWAESTINGFRSDYIEYLRMSYQLGPNEGWISLKRNQAAFALFGQLPPELAEKVVSEFVSLVEWGFHSEAANILAGPAWRLRDRIIPRLKDVDPQRLKSFANVLRSREIDIVIPGVKQADDRRR